LATALRVALLLDTSALLTTVVVVVVVVVVIGIAGVGEWLGVSVGGAVGGVGAASGAAAQQQPTAVRQPQCQSDSARPVRLARRGRILALFCRLSLEKIAPGSREKMAFSMQ
jgi:hypothetical protein